MIELDNILGQLTLTKILVGGLIGFIASFFVGTENRIMESFIVRMIIYIIAGIAGSQLGHFLISTSSDILSFVISVFGAVIILAILAFIFKKR
jgi:uncharacterized membrane protein YeaQ/YmgE (transglycosylase-associated protein family)